VPSARHRAGIGVHGKAPDVGGRDIGVKGEGPTGVQGISTGSGNGVSGRGLNGVLGEFIGPSSIGPLGSGVFGLNMSGQGWGVHARSNASYPLLPGKMGGAAVWAENTANGLAGHFNGDVIVIGTVSKNVAAS
jgi:hypothetical protein